jgi:hypothetical protein
VPVEALARDLAEMPWGFSPRQQETIGRALDHLASQVVAVGQPYLDFNPRNVLYHEGTVALIDPPGECRQGVLLWDFSTFRVDLCRELWKALVKRPWGRRRARVAEGLAAFEQAYVQGYAPRHPEVAVSPLLIRLLELQRVGQLLKQRVGHFRLVMRFKNNPLPLNRGRFQSMVFALGSLSLLEAQKRSLLWKMAQELS